MSIPRISKALSALLALGVLIYATWLLNAGVAITTMMEDSASITVSRAPAPAAWLPLLASLTILGGLWKGKAAAYWAGTALLLAFSLLYLFSTGGGLLLPALALIILGLIALSFKET